MSAVARLLSRAGRHSAAYGGGMALTVLAGLASLAVFTRLLEPREYGTLAVLLAFAAGLTLACNLGTLQGVLNAVFGSSDEDVDDAEEEGPGQAGRKREALGTGLVLTAGIAVAATVVVWLLAAPAARLLLGSAAEAGGIRLAGGAGALGAIWRLLQAVPRLERRPRLFVALEVTRPVLAIAVGLPFVLAGAGPEGVLWGLFIATAAMIVVALVAMRRSYRLAFDRRVLSTVGRLGAAFVPFGLATWAVQHGGVLVLAGSSPDAEVGFFRVAMTLGNVVLAASSVFFMAWLPLKRTSVFAAAQRERGHGWLNGTLVTWFVAGGAALVVALCAGADQLIAVAGPEYRSAAELIPLVAGAALAQSAFLLAYRVAAFRRKRLALAVVAPLVAVAFLGTARLLVGSMGAPAIPLAAAGAFLLGSAVMVWLGQRGGRPVSFDWPRLGATLLLAGACIAVREAFAGRLGSWQPVLDVALVLAFPVLLVAFRVISARQVRVLAGAGREGVRPERSRRAQLLDRMAEVPPPHAATLSRAVGPWREGGQSPPAAGEVAAALRAVAGAGGPNAHDRAIGRYLLSDLSRAERDAMARALWRRGVDPAELDRLEQTLDALRRLPARAWPLSGMRS